MSNAKRTVTARHLSIGKQQPSQCLHGQQTEAKRVHVWQMHRVDWRCWCVLLLFVVLHAAAQKETESKESTSAVIWTHPMTLFCCSQAFE